MVVVWMAGDMLEAAIGRIVGHPPNQTAFDKQRQVAVKGRLRKTRTLEPQRDEQIVHGEMVVDGEDFLDDHAAIARETQAAEFEKAAESFERLQIGWRFGRHKKYLFATGFHYHQREWWNLFQSQSRVKKMWKHKLFVCEMTQPDGLRHFKSLGEKKAKNVLDTL